MRQPYRHPASITQGLPELRSIPTRDADLYVPWNAACVREVLRRRHITAEDFDVRAPSLKAFVRDLAPLAAQEALAGAPDRRLTRLVRALFRRLHGELDAAAPRRTPSHA
jgi:hypothetical protein